MWWKDLNYTNYCLVGNCQYCVDKSVMIQFQVKIVERKCNLLTWSWSIICQTGLNRFYLVERFITWLQPLWFLISVALNTVGQIPPSWNVLSLWVVIQFFLLPWELLLSFLVRLLLKWSCSSVPSSSQSHHTYDSSTTNRSIIP